MHYDSVVSSIQIHNFRRKKILLQRNFKKHFTIWYSLLVFKCISSVLGQNLYSPNQGILVGPGGPSNRPNFGYSQGFARSAIDKKD